MKARFDFYSASPDTMKAVFATQKVIDATGLEQRLVELVKLRASQINGCLFCMSMHAADARNRGIPDEVLDTLPGWHEAPWFSQRERAALAWTDPLTRLSDAGHDDEALYQALADQFTEKECTDLTYVIGVINMLNRFGVGFRRAPD